MSTNEKSGVLELDRLNSLFAWWGTPNSASFGQMEAQFRHVRTFVFDVHKAFYAAAREHDKQFLATNDRLVSAFTKLAHARQLDTLAAAQSEISASLVDSANQQAEIWTDLANRVKECHSQVEKANGKKPKGGT